MSLRVPEDRRLEKLPVWCKDYITALERDINSLKSRISEMSNTSVTRIVSDRYGKHHPIYLPEHDPVRFYLGDSENDKYDNWVDVFLQDGYIRIMTGNILTVSPVSGNVINLTSDRNKRI